jgi:hypothetical protein
MKNATSSGICAGGGGAGRRLGLGLADQDGHAHLELGRLDGDGQPGVEAAREAFIDVGETLGIGVAGHDDVRAARQQRLEGVEELLLRAFLAGEELDVVDQQQVEVVVLRLQLVEGLALVILDDVGDELLGVQVQHAGVGLVAQQLVADRVHQVGLAEAHAAVDEQRVVHRAGRAGHVQGGGARHLVGAAGHQGVEGERGVEPVRVHRRRGVHGTRRGRLGAGRAAARRGGRHRRGIQRAIEHVAQALRRLGGGEAAGQAGARGHRLARGERQFEPDRLAGELGEHDLDARRVLRADPVELEAVGHAHHRHRAFAVVGEVGRRQWTDPGAELLFGQLGGETFATAVPKVYGHCGQVLLEPPDSTRAEAAKKRLSTESSHRSIPPHRTTVRGKSLTLKGFL